LTYTAALPPVTVPVAPSPIVQSPGADKDEVETDDEDVQPVSDDDDSDDDDSDDDNSDDDDGDDDDSDADTNYECCWCGDGMDSITAIECFNPRCTLRMHNDCWKKKFRSRRHHFCSAHAEIAMDGEWVGLSRVV
jgi:hypothetical protein